MIENNFKALSETKKEINTTKQNIHFPKKKEFCTINGFHFKIVVSDYINGILHMKKLNKKESEKFNKFLKKTGKI